MRGVRGVLLAFLGLTIGAGVLHAQEEKDRLVNRLLRPDLSLENSQQNKKFVAAGNASIDRKFEVKTNFGTGKRSTKSFIGIPDVLAGVFGTKKFPRARAAVVARAAISAKPTGAQTPAVTKKSPLVGESSQAHKVAGTRDYPDNRPFLGRGTRQEILSQLNHPLTIEEVRQLLNREQPPTDSP